jgi:hypothetical protein
VPLATLNQAKLIPAHGGHGGQVGRLPPGHAGGEGALGLRESAAEPLSRSQVPLGDGFQQPLAVTKHGQSPRGEHGRGLGVTAEIGEIASAEGVRRGDVHQPAAGSAGSGLERLSGSVRRRALGRFEQ